MSQRWDRGRVEEIGHLKRLRNYWIGCVCGFPDCTWVGQYQTAQIAERELRHHADTAHPLTIPVYREVRL